MICGMFLCGVLYMIFGIEYTYNVQTICGIISRISYLDRSNQPHVLLGVRDNICSWYSM